MRSESNHFKGLLLRRSGIVLASDVQLIGRDDVGFPVVVWIGPGDGISVRAIADCELNLSKTHWLSLG
jgi:hypothetical protein